LEVDTNSLKNRLRDADDKLSEKSRIISKLEGELDGYKNKLRSEHDKVISIEQTTTIHTKELESLLEKSRKRTQDLESDIDKLNKVLNDSESTSKKTQIEIVTVR
jgi:predicted RNase H-like nuclease (RuvC/YqgF family)